MNLDALLERLDSDQIDAVTSAGAPLAIIAAAGSGKTTVLTRRIAHRLESGSALGQHVLALTFTAQAANELRRRVRSLGLRDRIEAGTFHAVALRLLRQRALDQNQPVLTIAADRTRLMNEAIRELTIKADVHSVMQDLDWCRARMVPVRSSTALSRRSGRREALPVEQLAALAERYDLIKRRRGVMDFDDVLEHCLQALRNDKAWAAGVRWRFRHLFVDEAQDLNPLQHALLETIRDGRPDICLVGDPRQAIFAFNGAEPAIMINVDKLYPGITIVRLRNNYRCSPQVLDAARRVLLAAGQHDDSQSAAPNNAPVTVISHADENGESAAVAQILRQLTGPHGRWHTCAVLARTTAQLTHVSAALAHRGVPVARQGEAAPKRAISRALADAYSQRNNAALGEWIEQVSSEPEPDPVRARVAEAADRFLAQGTGMSFKAWVELHSPFDDLQEAAKEDAVELLTFHAAKGREWPNVIVIGAETGLVPHSGATTPDQKAEEARLLYVACTRAKEQLIVSWAASRNGKAAHASPLIADIATSIDAPCAPAENFRLPMVVVNGAFVALSEWRRNAARAAGVAPQTVCSDEALRLVAEHRPISVAEVAALTDLGPIAALRIAPRMLAVLENTPG